jgi:uncharacterized C2H2 Zn-finger protein
MTEELLPCPFCDKQAMEASFKELYGIPMSAAFRQWDNEKIAQNFIRGWKAARAKPKYKRVDLEEMFMKQDDERNDALSIIMNTYNTAIDDIKSKYGDLFVEVK